MKELVNLVVDLDGLFTHSTTRGGVRIETGIAADERTLAWIDDEFGGSWSSEAHIASNVIAFRDGAPVGFATYDAKGLGFAWLRGLARVPGVGVFGPFGVAESERGKGLGRRLLELALAGLRERGYKRALIAAVGSAKLIEYYADAVGATIAERFDVAAWVAQRPRVVVMVSGNGTNLQSVLDGARERRLPLDIVSVVCNNPNAYAIERARTANVPVVLLPWKRKEEPRELYDARLLEAVSAQRPDLILMLGWMHLLSEPFVRAFPSLLNLHPAFLPLDPQHDDVGLPDGTVIPAFRGAHAVGDALAAGSVWTGATVHAVTPDTDRGPVLVRRPLHIDEGEDEAAIMARLHPLEHRVVDSAIWRWLYERLR